jgi:hypothetical protein
MNYPILLLGSRFGAATVGQRSTPNGQEDAVTDNAGPQLRCVGERLRSSQRRRLRPSHEESARTLGLGL